AATTLAAGVPEARFLIVGEADTHDAEYRRRLEAYADRLGLGRRVVFTGLRLDVPAVLDEVAVSVLPSLSEGLSNVLLESMARGGVATCTRPDRAWSCGGVAGRWRRTHRRGGGRGRFASSSSTRCARGVSTRCSRCASGSTGSARGSVGSSASRPGSRSSRWS